MTLENRLNGNATEDENDEAIVEWSQEQLRKRSQELQLLDENGICIAPLLDNRRAQETIDRNRLTTDDGLIGEFDDGSKSASTTSDSQVCNQVLHCVELVPSRCQIIRNLNTFGSCSNHRLWKRVSSGDPVRHPNFQKKRINELETLH